MSFSLGQKRRKHYVLALKKRMLVCLFVFIVLFCFSFRFCLFYSFVSLVSFILYVGRKKNDCHDTSHSTAPSPLQHVYGLAHYHMTFNSAFGSSFTRSKFGKSGIFCMFTIFALLLVHEANAKICSAAYFEGIALFHHRRHVYFVVVKNIPVAVTSGIPQCESLSFLLQFFVNKNDYKNENL